MSERQEKSTPGPWHVVSADLRLHGYRIFSGERIVGNADNIADAHLIADAPDMYAILNRMAELYDESDARLNRLKKAQADFDLDEIANCMTQGAECCKQERKLIDAARALLKEARGES